MGNYLWRTSGFLRLASAAWHGLDVCRLQINETIEAKNWTTVDNMKLTVVYLVAVSA